MDNSTSEKFAQFNFNSNAEWKKYVAEINSTL